MQVAYLKTIKFLDQGKIIITRHIIENLLQFLSIHFKSLLKLKMDIPVKSFMNYLLLHLRAKRGMMTKKVMSISGRTTHLYYSFTKMAGSPIPTLKVSAPSGLPYLKQLYFFFSSVKH